LVQLVGSEFDKERADSLKTRFTNEDALVNKAFDRPLFGWGGWGRNRVTDRTGKDVSITDGWWVIVLGDRGLVGLVALGGLLLLPVARFAFSWPADTWHTTPVAPVAACAVTLALWATDSLFNAMVLPLYLVMAGGLAGAVPPPPTPNAKTL
jgi:O-antigen ligase